MSTTQAAALSFLMAQHSTEESQRDASRQSEIVKVEVTMVPRAVKPRKVSANYQAAVAQHSVMPSSKTDATVDASVKADLPPKGSLGPRGFIKALREARDQNQRIFAIAAYVGYDRGAAYGTQEMAAVSLAKREINGQPIGGMDLAEKRSAFRSATGFVAGMPDATQKKIADLMARETASAEALILHEKDAADKSRSTADRTLSKGLAEVERERLREIREDLKRFGA